MRSEVGSAGPSELRELCGRFEQVLLATLVPKSLFRGSAEDGDGADGASARGAAAALFTQALAAALERSGGIGLGGELLRLLAAGRP